MRARRVKLERRDSNPRGNNGQQIRRTLQTTRMQLRPHNLLPRMARSGLLHYAVCLLSGPHVRALARPRKRTLHGLPARIARTNHARGPHHAPYPYPHLHPQGIARGNTQHRAQHTLLPGMGQASPSQVRARVHSLWISRRHVTTPHRSTRRKR